MPPSQSSVSSRHRIHSSSSLFPYTLMMLPCPPLYPPSSSKLNVTHYNTKTALKPQTGKCSADWLLYRLHRLLYREYCACQEGTVFMLDKQTLGDPWVKGPAGWKEEGFQSWGQKSWRRYRDNLKGRQGRAKPPMGPGWWSAFNLTTLERSGKD